MGAVPNVHDFHLCSDLKFASFPKTDFPVSVCVYGSCLLFRSPFNADSSVSLSSMSPVTFISIGPYFGLWVGTIMTQEDFVEDEFLYRVSSGVQDQGCWGAHLWTGFWCDRNLSCVCSFGNTVRGLSVSYASEHTKATSWSSFHTSNIFLQQSFQTFNKICVSLMRGPVCGKLGHIHPPVHLYLWVQQCFSYTSC